ncbi:MAG: LPS assembly protein LptD [Desulfuromonadales bacterium]
MLSLLITGQPLAQPLGDVGDSEGPVAIEADEFRFDEKTQTYRAEGSVHMRYGDMDIKTESMRWEADTGDVLATDGVRMEDQGNIMVGESLDFNLETEQGVLQQGRVFAKERNFHIVGDAIEKVGENDFRITKGTFTTCDGEVPDWKFGARHLDVTLGGYARAKHVLFRIRDIPVLYLPYLVYPVKTERESGFLMPRYGHSDSKGVELSLAYYLVLARNMDATFYLDYLSRMGVGKGLEYRYILGDDNEGEFKGYHVNGTHGHENRHALDWEHEGTLPGQIRLSADAEYVSDREYFEDFGEIAEEYNKSQVESILSLNKQMDKSALTFQLKYTENLEGDNDQTLQRLPEIEYVANRRSFGETPLYYGLEASSVYFWRREGVRGVRLSTRPELALVTRTAGLSLEMGSGYRYRQYWTSDEGPGNVGEGIYDIFGNLSTQVSRVFHLGGDRISKIRHSIEPEVDYLYVPEEDQSRLPRFDRFDRIGAKNLLRYALTNRFTAKLDSEGGTRYHDFLYLRLSQEYDIRKARNDDTEEEPFGDVRLELILQPTSRTYLDIDADYDVHDSSSSFSDRFRSFATRVGARDDSGNAIAVETRYQRDNTDYVSGSIDLAWLKPLYARYEHRYNLSESRSLEKVAKVEYRSQCWSLFLSYRDRLEDEEYFVTFSMTGVGNVLEFGGSLSDDDEGGT